MIYIFYEENDCDKFICMKLELEITWYPLSKVNYCKHLITKLNSDNKYNFVLLIL